ncbi:MAG TPA: TetR/AcrR family transcriptional regulator [Hyphomonadaceae bacterium]|nr:TetR/AcrR family transcriptional regulator [Hyphomonadaceae bacterium]
MAAKRGASANAGETVTVVRGPHAERTAAMRRRLIDAAIDCLGRLGYGATTLQVVTDAAGVSRGAVLHHFPNKVDLMIAVAEYAAGKQNRHVSRLLADTKPGIDRYLAITMATWDAMTKPAAIALLEIMMGSRSDKDLATRFPAVIASLEKYQREGVWEQAQSAGITDKATVEAMVHLHNAAMRGLALELMFSRDEKKASSAMKLLVRYKRQLTGDLITKPTS